MLVAFSEYGMAGEVLRMHEVTREDLALLMAVEEEMREMRKEDG
jgi:hypothetical protein